MEHTALPHRAALVIAILLSAGAFVVLPAPEARADVTFVPVVHVLNNTLSLDLTVYGGYVRANVTREFVLNETKLLDEIFNASVVAPESITLSALSEEPTCATLSPSQESFNISFASMAEGAANILVKYSYSVQFSSAGSLNFTITPGSKDEINPMWEILDLVVSALDLRVHSNIPVSIWNGTAFYNGTDVNVSDWAYTSHDFWDFFPRPASYLVTWADGPRSRVNETLFSRLVPEHRPMMEDLIRSEFVNITIGKGAGVIPYRLDGKFCLNGTTLAPYSTVWLWFPNNITCATGTCNGDRCLIEPSVRDGQNGFYIRARFEYMQDTTLVVNITGNLTDPWCDFFIVTAPVGNSSVRYILPPSAHVTAYGSPFENAVFNSTPESTVLDFCGKCAGLGPVHIGWDWQTYPGTWVEASASDVNTSAARIVWSTSGNSEFKEYRICMADRPGSPGQVVGRVTSQTATSFLVRDLLYNTTYFFTVRKVLAGNATVDSNTVEVRTPAIPLPAPELTVYYTGDNGTVPVLRWTRCDHPDFWRYLLIQSDRPGYLGQGVFHTNDSSVLERAMTGLARNTTYYFTLRVNAGTVDCVDSRQVKVVLPLDAPRHFPLKAWRKSYDPETVYLHWDGADPADFSRYELYISTEPGELGTRLTNITQSSLVDYTAGGLPAGKDRWFTVRIVLNQSGYIDSYQAVAVTVQADPPVQETPEPAEPWAAIGFGVLAMLAVASAAFLVHARRRRK
jgi:hypothetical protein